MGIANDLREVAAGVVGSDVSGFAAEADYTPMLKAELGQTLGITAAPTAP